MRELDHLNGLCTGSGWHQGAVALELRCDDGKGIYRLKTGSEIAFRIDGARRCIGYRPPPGDNHPDSVDGDSLLPCPEAAEGISAAQCEPCFAAAKILPCLRCDGERCRNPARRPSCVRPDNHAVYLASFGHGLFKVGVARWERRRERVLEQGARAALIVARDDGQMVRRVEQQIRRAGIPDRIPAGVKLSALTQRGRPADLRAELEDAATGMRRRVRAAWLKRPEVVDIPEPQILPYRPQLLSPDPDLALRATLREVVGQIAICEADTGELVAFELSSLTGYRLAELAPDEAGSGQMAIAIAA